QYVKLAKVEGEMVWHTHDNEDEMFYIVKGNLVLRLRDREVHLEEGEFYIVPKGVEHQPYAETEAHIMLFEPKATAHTGAVQSEQTIAIENQEWL
ncbi:MAG: cupin domain-containing protein, partial [Gammaproteobacteria bacterium]|nr:cupin domain-containing protein [Gammaproteobacteria bacterium]